MLKLTAIDFFYPVMLLIASASFWSVANIRLENKSAKWFAAAYAFGAFGFLAEIFRFVLPNFSLSLLGGGSFTAMTVFVSFGLVLRAGRKPPFKLLLGIAMPSVLIAWALSFTAFPIVYRIIFLQFMNGILYAIAIGFFYKKRETITDKLVLGLIGLSTLIVCIQPLAVSFISGLPTTRAAYDASTLFASLRVIMGVSALSVAIVLVRECVSSVISELRQLANRDKLTGLLNRRGFEDQLALSQASAALSGTQIALIMFDIDHFKNINDTYGHQIGDIVLKQFADVLSYNKDNAGLAGRLGGEEFVLALPVKDIEEAVKRANLVRVRWERYRHYDGDDVFSATVSAGVALHADNESLLNATLNRADSALYLAKRLGRNTVSTQTDLAIAKLRGAHQKLDDKDFNQLFKADGTKPH